MHRWWVNWKDPIFNQGQATAEDSETGKTDLRRTESEPDLTFNYSKLTGEIDGEDGDGFAPNGNLNNKTRTPTATTRAGTTATVSRKTATAASRGGGARGGSGARNQTAASRCMKYSQTFLLMLPVEVKGPFFEGLEPRQRRRKGRQWDPALPGAPEPRRPGARSIDDNAHH